MVASEQIVNDAESVLTSAITSGATSLAITNAALFPTAGLFRIIVDGEIMKVTSVSGTTLNVTRGVDGTTPANHVLGSQVDAIVTRDGLKTLINERVASTADERPPFRIADASGDVLTSTDFTEDDAAATMTVIDNTNGSITLKHDPFATSEKLASILRSAPTAPYVVTGAYRITTLSATASDGGIFGPVFRRSSNDGRIIWRHRPLVSTTDTVWRADHYSGSVFQAGLSSYLRYSPSVSNIVWFKIEDDNTDLKMSTSFDGVHFVEHFSEGRAVTLGAAPDQIGLSIDNLSSFDAYITLLVWQE